MLHKPSFVAEEEGTVLFFSVLDRRCCATCWERDLEEFAFDDFERSLPHLFLYLFLFKRKTKVETKRTLPILNTGESKLYSKKSEKCLKHQFFFENPGYLPVVLCLWSQAQPWGFILQLSLVVQLPASPPLIDLSSFRLQG